MINNSVSPASIKNQVKKKVSLILTSFHFRLRFSVEILVIIVPVPKFSMMSYSSLRDTTDIIFENC